MEYSFKEFKNSDALKFGLRVLEIVEKEHLNNVRIRVRYGRDIVFQYLMDGKKGEEWLDRKERTVMDSKHSSMYVFEHKEQYLYMIDNPQYAVCGGGYPLIVNQKVVGAFCVSGLKHYDDHNIILRVIREMVENEA